MQVPVKVERVYKAIVATLVVFLGTLSAALTSDQSLGDINAQTWIAIALATVIAGGGVYKVRNAPPPTLSTSRKTTTATKGA